MVVEIMGGGEDWEDGEEDGYRYLGVLGRKVQKKNTWY